MGRKKRNTNAPPPPPLLSNHRRDHINNNNNNNNIIITSLSTTDHNSVSVSDLFSVGYSAVKAECAKALNAIRRGNHTKAVRLMKELCLKYDNNNNINKNNNNVYLGLVYRVQGTVCVKVAGIMDDPNAKRRYLRNAVEAARQATVLSPNSVEFAHFYANLLYETARELKDYEDSVRECERALMVKNPVDPATESLQDERRGDGRVENVRSEIRAVLQRANVGTLSSWVRKLGHGDDNVMFFPVRKVFEDPMDVRVVQGRRVNDVKKASKTDEERKKEIEVKVAAARLLQRTIESSESHTEGEKGPESSSGPNQRTGERRKSGKAKKTMSTSERKDCVLAYWKSMGTDLKKDLYRIRITDIKNYFKSLKDGLGYEVITEALLFGESNNGWRYWMCCKCSEKFADAELHKRHIVDEHMDRLSPKLQAVLPQDVDNEWIEMLLTHSWRPLDVDAAVRMIELQSHSSVFNSELGNDGPDDSYGYEGMWDLSSGGNGTSVGCVPMECDQSEGQKGYFNPESWPLSNDSERSKLLEKIRTLFQLLIKHKCLAASHLTKIIKFSVEELHPQLLNYSVDQSPFCICLLGATELRKVLMFLQELSHSCGVGRYSEKGNALEELNFITQVNGMAEKLVFDEDGSSLVLDEHSLPFKFNAKSCQDDDDDDDSLLSWIFMGPTSREELTFWTCTRDENMHKGIEILENISKEFSHLQSLCVRKLEHMSCEEALQLIEDLCLEEDKRREHGTEFAHQSYESLLRKRRDEITRHDNDVTHVNRFEVEVLTNVLQEADSMNVKQFGFEDMYDGVNVNSYVCDLESGEDDWRVNDYFQQLDSCIKSGIRKQKEQLSVELSKIDARIMRNLSEIQQLEAKIGPLCAHDFGLIVVPLIKSYLRVHLENLAEKDATEKSDAAREAFLAELALDSKKGTGDIPKHLNDKVKDKRKNKEYRKTKDSKPTSIGELDVLPNEKAEKASLGSNVIDEQPNGSVDEVGVPFHEQEDEVWRRKIELEAEERKLEATLEYQRRIEDETKQRHLAEQHKSSSRMTQMSMEPVNQSNGLLTPLEDGLSERTGLLYLGIVENGALLYESRVGRRGRRQKNLTKLSDGKQQPLSSGKETTEFGQNTYIDRLQDVSSSGNNGTRILMLQAEEDDEKRFQADLSKAVRQSLDAFHSPKQYSSISGLMIPEDRFVEGEDSCVTSIEVPPDNVNGSDVYGTGLKNEVGEYNCFLNVIIQSLWHLRRFREEFLSTSTSFHLHVGDPCVTCALYDIFSALNSVSTNSKVQAVAPTSLRIALSKLYPESNFFQEAQMNDASEVLGVIFDCLHQSFTSVTGISGTELAENNIMGSWECINKACTAHSCFGLDIFERMNCHNCGLETRSLKYTSFFHQINANALRTMKVMCPEGSFDELLNVVEMNHQLACDPEDGGCGKLNYIHHILSTPPHVFTTVLGWQNTCESVEDIKATLAALSTEIDLSVPYRGLDPNNTCRLVSVVCYYGQHYHCFAYSHVHQRWVMYDDKTVKVIGRWEDVISACEKGHLQPQVLFYEAVN